MQQPNPSVNMNLSRWLNRTQWRGSWIPSKHEGKLWLIGLTELGDAAAESLSKYNGEKIDLNLTEISDAAAESLSLNNCIEICALKS